MKKLFGFILILVVMLFGACGEDSDLKVVDTKNEIQAENSTLNYEELEFVFLTVINQIPFWDDHKLALKDIQEKYGIKTSFVGPETWDTEIQIQMLYEIADKKPTGILLFPSDDDPRLAKAINDVIDMGIPLVTIIGDVTGSRRYTKIGVNNYEAGRVGGKELAEAIGGKGEVLLGGTKSEIFTERMRGYREEFAENYPEIKIVAEIDDEANPVVAPKRYLEALKKYPNVVGIGGTDAESGKGAARAIIELEKQGEIKIVGMDRDDRMLTYLEEGIITSSIAQMSYLETLFAVELILDNKRKNMSRVEEWEKYNLKTYPEKIEMGVWVVNKENIHLFLNK